MTHPTKHTLAHYAPHPRSWYDWEAHGIKLGPANSKMFDTQETWNLAYLSYPYEALRDHPDPAFSVHVRRTAQTRLDGTGADLTGAEPLKTVASMLGMPAPQFVFKIESHPILKALPLYVAYGETWLNTIRERSWVCQVDDYRFPDIQSVDDAVAHLKRISLASKK